MIQYSKYFKRCIRIWRNGNWNRRNSKIYGSWNLGRIAIEVRVSQFVIVSNRYDLESNLVRKIVMDLSGLLSFRNIWKDLFSIKIVNLISGTSFCWPPSTVYSKLTGSLKDTSGHPLLTSPSKEPQICWSTSPTTPSKRTTMSTANTKKATKSATTNFSTIWTKLRTRANEIVFLLRYYRKWRN